MSQSANHRGFFIYAGLLLLFFRSPLSAWNATGHMTVAYIAYGQLDGQTRARVDALLKAHPDYATWVAGIPEDPAFDRLRGVTAFLCAATWPDQLRDDPRFQNGPEAGANHAAGQNSLGIPDTYRHQNWHYIDRPVIGAFDDLKIDTSNTQYRKAPTVLTQIQVSRQAVGNSNLSSTYRAYYLSWLEHLVGDIHQPLHAVARMTPDEHGKLRGDAGGNAVRLAGLEDIHNLHWYWDSLLGDDTSLAGIASRADALTRFVKHPAGVSLDEEDWFEESSALAISVAYKGLAHATETQHGLVLPAGYSAEARNTANARIAIAGYRLAGVIEQALH
ncbi:MAG: S1/P1 nuclease [Bryobacteraceae bacterium]